VLLWSNIAKIYLSKQFDVNHDIFYLEHLFLTDCSSFLSLVTVFQVLYILHVIIMHMNLASYVEDIQAKTSFYEKLSALASLISVEGNHCT
jgi:hypothetical protein